MKILVSGFEPFGGQKVNPALEAIKRLPERLEGDSNIEIATVALPTEVGASLEVLKREIDRYRPDAVLSIGQAGGRPDITLETVAVNICDFPIPDNAGKMPKGEPVVAGGADGLFTTLPNKRIIAALLNEGIPAALSNTAGTYVCNYICYGLCNYLREEYPKVLGGFMHVPYLPEQVAELYKSGRIGGTPSMAMDVIVRAVKCAIVSIFSETGEEAGAGSTH